MGSTQLDCQVLSDMFIRGAPFTVRGRSVIGTFTPSENLAVVASGGEDVPRPAPPAAVAAAGDCAPVAPVAAGGVALKGWHHPQDQMAAWVQREQPAELAAESRWFLREQQAESLAC